MAKTCKKINVFNSQYKHVLKPPFIMCVIAGMFAAACFMGNSFPSMLGPKRKIIIKNSTFLKFKQNSFHPWYTFLPSDFCRYYFACEFLEDKPAFFLLAMEAQHCPVTPARLRNLEPWGSGMATYLVLSTPTPASFPPSALNVNRRRLLQTILKKIF